jgi:cytochrome c-type biogenesis protein CcmE
MTRKRRRMIAVLAGLAMLGLATGFTLFALTGEGALSYFCSPTDLTNEARCRTHQIRLGGLVEHGSVARADDGKTVRFKVTDGSKDVGVTYVGVLPDLFREGQGVVIEGALGADGNIRAASVLAKHDENYMPREVVDALKKSGHWQETGPPPGTAAQR